MASSSAHTTRSSSVAAPVSITSINPRPVTHGTVPSNRQP
jgi:hypothetical protein